MQHLQEKSTDFFKGAPFVESGARTFMSGAAELDKEFRYG
jgi:hypothetical protein